MPSPSLTVDSSPACNLTDVRRLPIAKWAWPELLKFGLPLLAVTIGIAVFAGSYAPWAALPAAMLLMLLWFFRDPPRAIPMDQGVLLAPADGRVADITPVGHYDFFGCPAVRVGLFLSVFDVHVNRAPTDSWVVDTHYAPGAKHDARSKEAISANESQWIGLEVDSFRYAIRQVSGAVARRIVCAVEPGQKLAAGERFGMIKFGSRTELIVPEWVDISAQVGDKVKAGVTVLARR